jgi:hypothetical protein
MKVYICRQGTLKSKDDISLVGGHLASMREASTDLYSSSMTEEDPNGNAEMCHEGSDNFRWASILYWS